MASAPTDAVAARASRLRELGVAASAAGHPATAARHLRHGLRLLGWPAPARTPDSPQATGDPLVARTLLSLAFAESEQGHMAPAMALLDEAERLLAPDERGILLQQRSLLLLRLGRSAEALALLDAALPLLARSAETVILARALLNRAALHLGAGRTRAARDDLRRCLDVAHAEGLHLVAAKAVHNLGHCEALTGDVPAALRAFDDAARRYLEHGAGMRPVAMIDKAKLLLTVGLVDKAATELAEALALLRRQRLGHYHAEAELLLAQAALANDDLATARIWADRAVTHFRRRGNTGWAALADLTRLQVSFRCGRTPGAPATRLADRLRELRYGQDAVVAELLAIRGLVRAGRPGEAVPAVPRVPPRASLEAQLLGRLTRAELAAAAGRRGEALRHLRAGLTALHRQRSRLGSVDLQSGTAALGLELARTGLDMALDSGLPRLVFAWSERSRGQAFRVRPVRPPADPRTAEAMAELRQLHRLIGESAHSAGRAEPQAPGGGRSEPRWQRRRTELERFVREQGWQTQGTGQSNPEATFDAVTAELAGARRAMIAFVRSGRRLVALVMRDGTARIRLLGDPAAAEEACRRLLSDLDALARRRLPDRLRDAVHASVHRQCAILTRDVLAPLGSLLGDDDLVLVPTGWLSAIPWGLLAPLAGRPVTVVPSASVWLRARKALAGSGNPLLVAGPHLTHAAAEVGAIGEIQPASVVLHGDAATVEATLRGMDGASLAHIAAHGQHRADNFLFSSLDLADGPLMAHDLQQLAVSPKHAVLSACDVGRTVVRAGDELLGFTAALLYAGTTTVVSSVVPVPDETAIRVMVAYHREIAGGAEPAAALARASLLDPLVSFVCFGAG